MSVVPPLRWKEFLTYFLAWHQMFSRSCEEGSKSRGFFPPPSGSVSSSSLLSQSMASHLCRGSSRVWYWSPRTPRLRCSNNRPGTSSHDKFYSLHVLIKLLIGLSKILGCTKSRYISNSCRWKSFARPTIPATMSSIWKTLYRHPPSSVTEAGGRQSPREKKAAEVPSPTLSPQVSPFSRGLLANERDVPHGLSPVPLWIFHSPPGDVTQSWGFNHRQ